MQLMDNTARRYNVRNQFDPRQSIRGGVRYLIYLDKFWSDYISDPNEKLKFILASYNVGLGHVIDARKLAQKYGRDPSIWDDNVAYYLLHKSDPRFYKDPVVESGYCKGEEPVLYVTEILYRYGIYQQLVSS
jgi:membrane-bound lytic murein transglycosylase F